MNDLEQFGLNERQTAFVRAILKGESPAAAARAARYDSPSAADYLMSHLSVRAAVHEGVQRALQAEAAVSLHVLKRIRDDDNAPARVRADIGLKTLQLAGHVVPTTASSAAEKPLAEMTRDEMVAYIERNQAAIDRAESELAARAKDVSVPNSVPNSVPESTETTPKPLSFLD